MSQDLTKSPDSTKSRDLATTILLVRHGLTNWNAEKRWQGHADIPLNKKGIAQAEALATRLADWPIQTIYTSDLKRASMTADAIGHAINVSPIPDPRWRERDVGVFSGRTTSEIREMFPEVWSEQTSGVLNPPDGEYYLDLFRRASLAFDAIRAKHHGEMIAIVSHGGTLYNVVLHVLGIPPEHYGRFSFDNASLSIITINERGARLTLLNDTCHLQQFD